MSFNDLFFWFKGLVDLGSVHAIFKCYTLLLWAVSCRSTHNEGAAERVATFIFFGISICWLNQFVILITKGWVGTTSTHWDQKSLTTFENVFVRCHQLHKMSVASHMLIYFSHRQYDSSTKRSTRLLAVLIFKRTFFCSQLFCHAGRVSDEFF